MCRHVLHYSQSQGALFVPLLPLALPLLLPYGAVNFQSRHQEGSCEMPALLYCSEEEILRAEIKNSYTGERKEQ